jgi:hypothetical protein
VLNKIRIELGFLSELFKPKAIVGSRRDRNRMIKFLTDFEEFPITESTMPLAKAATKVKVRPSTLRKLLANEDKIRPEKMKGVRVSVQNDDIARFAADYADAVPFARIAGILGVGRKIPEALRDQGRLPIWIPGGKMGNKHRYLLRRKDIEGWVDCLIGDARELQALPDECITLADAPLKIQVSIGTLVDAIKDGRLKIVGRLKEKPKFGGAVIRIVEASSIRHEEISRKVSEKRRGSRG